MVKYLAVLLLVTSVLAFSKFDRHDVLYYRTGAPSGDWRLLKEADNDQVVTFSLALKQRNLDTLEQAFWDNANPENPQFAHHWTREEILKLIAPLEEVQTLIIDWLQHAAENFDANIQIKNMYDSMQVTAPVSVVNHLFKTNIHAFVNSKTRQVVFKHLGKLSVPSELSRHIELVTGITEFPPASALKNMKYKNVKDPSNMCNVPYTIKKLYNVPDDLRVTNPLANISVYAQFSGDTGDNIGFDVPDLTAFEQANGLAATPVNCVLGNAANFYSPDGDDLEAELDVQMIQGMAPGANTCFYVMSTNYGWMFEFAQQIFNTSNAPLVVSISYGWLENQQCSNETGDGLGNCTVLNIPNSSAYVARTNVEFMKLGLAGHTLLASSGDDGTVGGHQSEDDCTTMEPQFPASSPYVTVVGATSIEPSHNDTLDRASLPPVCTNSTYGCDCSTSTNEQPALAGNAATFATGGGFSNYSPMPDYQKKAVQAYLESGITLPTSALWNASGRGYPDVAAVGEAFCTIDTGSSTGYACDLSGGTSASAPLWAALVTLLNQDRLNSNKTPLGFINPMLYAMFDKSASKYFNNQFGEGNNSGECDASMGFYSVSGYWSPLTGLGSPHFDQIRQYVATLPTLSGFEVRLDPKTVVKVPMKFSAILFAIVSALGFLSQNVNAQNISYVGEFVSGMPDIQMGYDIKNCYVNYDSFPDIIVTGNATFWVIYGQEAFPYFGSMETIQIANADLVTVECALFSSSDLTDSIIIGDPKQNTLHAFQYNGSGITQINVYDTALNGNTTGRVEFGHKILVADVDSDLVLDLIVSDPGAQTVTVFYSNNTSIPFLFHSSILYPASGMGSRFGEDFFVADVIGTTALDLGISAPFYDNGDVDVGMVVVFEGSGNGLFVPGNPIVGLNPQDSLGSLMVSTKRLPGFGTADTILSITSKAYYFIPAPLSNITDFYPQYEDDNVTAIAFVDDFMNGDYRRELAVATVHQGDGYTTQLKIYESGMLPETSLGISIGWDSSGYIIRKIMDIDDKSPYTSKMIAVTQPSYNASEGRVIILQTNPASTASPSATPSASFGPVSPSSSPFTATSTDTSTDSSTGGDSTSSGTPGSDTTVIVASTVASGSACLIIIVAMAFWIRKKKKKDDSDMDESDDEDVMEVGSL